MEARERSRIVLYVIPQTSPALPSAPVNKDLQVHIPSEDVSPDSFEMSTATTAQIPPLYALVAR